MHYVQKSASIACSTKIINLYFGKKHFYGNGALVEGAGVGLGVGGQGKQTGHTSFAACKLLKFLPRMRMFLCGPTDPQRHTSQVGGGVS
jgi:hypothetical protein